MTQYSVVAWTADEVTVTDPDVFLEPGTNAFTVLSDSIDSLKLRLEALGVRVESVNRIECPPTPPLPG